MGKHDKKTGKGRLDKFYKLAKEQGYRARSAFKLVHLNRKYDLLAKSKCCIDLCAAPGGWLQVAEKYMPKGSLILGVDLHPIKPLPHVTTFVADITTPSCRQQLRAHMKDWKADLVLHDGAPNVGSAWVQDAFTQNELVLQSLKLATEFLMKGGNFVTKVFRSQDYNALMWVFGQLFKSVEATKPPSSRNVSAEIFVVCQNFLAPKHIDPKFLDPKHVFKDIAPLPSSITAPPPITDPSSSTQSLAASANAVAKSQSGSHAHANVFMPEKKRRHREGYAEGEYTNFHAASASQFVRGVDAVGLLGTMNKIEFVTDEEKGWLKSRHTTPLIVAAFEDLKVLGKGDFKQLMKWRLAIRLEIGLDVKAETTQDATEEVVVEPMDEEEQITEELRKLHESKMARQKREKRRANEKKARDLLKLQLNMTAPDDLDNDDRGLAGEEIFDLGEGEGEAKRRGRPGALDSLVAEEDGLDPDSDSDADASAADEDEAVFDSEEERELRLGALETELDGLYEEYQNHVAEKDAKFRVKQARMKDRNYDAWHGIQEGGEGDEGESSGDEIEGGGGWKKRVVKVPRRGDPAAEDEEGEEGGGGWDVAMASKAQIGESESDSDSDDDQPVRKQAKRKKVNGGMFGDDPSERPTKNGRHTKSIAGGGGLVTTFQEPEKRAQMSRQAQLWFDQSVFRGVGDLAALDGEDEDENEDNEDDDDDAGDEEADDESDEGEDGAVDEDGDVDMGSASDPGSPPASSTLDGASDDESFEIVPQIADDEAEWDVDDEDQGEAAQRVIKDKGLLTAEAITLATALVNRQTTASQLIDNGFNRLSSHHKDNLPAWFLDDESKHYRPNIPVTAESIAVLREKQRALDARPIKKVAEAKARKKMKAAARLEKAKKKAAGVMEAEDLGAGEKVRQVAKAMARGKGGEKRPEKKVVVARGANKGVKGRPKGVKGRYKIVDARMRKEVRALKRIKKANKRR